MSSSTSVPSVPITGIFVDPALSLSLKIKVKGKNNNDTRVGTAVGLLQGQMAKKVSDVFGLDPPMKDLDMTDEPTTFPSGTSLFNGTSFY
jgi:hypothetical protein